MTMLLALICAVLGSAVAAPVDRCLPRNGGYLSVQQLAEKSPAIIIGEILQSEILVNKKDNDGMPLLVVANFAVRVEEVLKNEAVVCFPPVITVQAVVMVDDCEDISKTFTQNSMYVMMLQAVEPGIFEFAAYRQKNFYILNEDNDQLLRNASCPQGNNCPVPGSSLCELMQMEPPNRRMQRFEHRRTNPIINTETNYNVSENKGDNIGNAENQTLGLPQFLDLQPSDRQIQEDDANTDEHPSPDYNQDDGHNKNRQAMQYLSQRGRGGFNKPGQGQLMYYPEDTDDTMFADDNGGERGDEQQDDDMPEEPEGPQGNKDMSSSEEEAMKLANGDITTPSAALLKQLKAQIKDVHINFKHTSSKLAQQKKPATEQKSDVITSPTLHKATNEVPDAKKPTDTKHPMKKLAKEPTPVIRMTGNAMVPPEVPANASVPEPAKKP